MPMRFFTPELYLRFNSADEAEADRAAEEWEQAILNYRRHLDELRDAMPSPVRKLSELCLHDAPVLGYDQVAEPFAPWGPFWSAVAFLSLQGDGQIVTLVYVLWDDVRKCPSPADWQFSKAGRHWLYDEIDTAAGPPNRFFHRILFSDGSVTEIPFFSVFIHHASLPAWQDMREQRIA